MHRWSTASASLLFALLPLSAAAADVKLAEVVQGTDHIRGEQSAQASLVVYSDFQCPFCKRFHATLDQIRIDYDYIRIVYRNFPLSMHAMAVPAAKAAECAAQIKGNDTYWSFVDGIFAMSSITTDKLRDLAMEKGISDSDYDNCLESSAILQKINDDKASGKLAGVTGTPTSFLIKPDGTAIKITGAVNVETLKKHLDKVEKPARQSYRDAKVETTKRTARVRKALKGVRRWK